MRFLLYLFAFEPLVAQGLWERRAPYPVAVTEVSAAALGGKMYAICGILQDGTRDTTLRIYDPYLDRWSAGPPVPIPGGGDHCNVAAAQGRLYVAGAIRIGTSFADGNTYEYDPSSSQWTTVGRMGEPRGSSGVAVIAGRIYVAGGLIGSRPVSTLESFDPATRQWTTLAPMPTARDHLTAQAVNGRLYAIAGRSGITDLRSNEEYDPATNAWRTRAPIPTARGGLASGNLRNRIQVFGGEGNSGRPEMTFEQHEEYEPASDTWGTLPLMLNPRHGLYGATIEGRIFAPGGGPRAGGTFSTSHDAFLLPPPQAPAITPNGVGNAASFRQELAPGTIGVIYGTNLSQGAQEATGFPLPGTLNTSTVRVNGTVMPLLYVSPAQINFHLPYVFVPGPVQITVTHATSTSEVFAGPIAMAAAPGLIAALPVGDVAVIFGTGLGRVDFPPRLGEPAAAEPPVRTIDTPEVTIGDRPAEVLFSGLAPGYVGLYQINARMPAGVTAGAAVVVRIGGRASNAVPLRTP